MLFHTYTAIMMVVLVYGQKTIQTVKSFDAYYCSLVTAGGSKIRSLNSSNSYGEYGVFSKGFDSSESPNQGNVRGIQIAYTNVLTHHLLMVTNH